MINDHFVTICKSRTVYSDYSFAADFHQGNLKVVNEMLQTKIFRKKFFFSLIMKQDCEF